MAAPERLSTSSMTRVRVTGNHSAIHSGCAAAWSGLRTAVQLQNVELTDTDNFDVLVVNGEGSMHHGRPTFKSKMRALDEAISRGRRGFLVNSVWQENPSTFDNVLNALDGVVVREVKSQADLAERHGVLARTSIDLSYFAPVEQGGSFQEFNNQIVVSDFLSVELGDFVRVTGGPLSKHAYLSLSDGAWDYIVRSLRTCRLFVTGRHHGVYAACRARVPFIALRGNSHKIEGLMLSAGVNLPVCRSIAELVERANAWNGDLTEFERLWRWLDSQRIEDALPPLGPL